MKTVVPRTRPNITLHEATLPVLFCRFTLPTFSIQRWSRKEYTVELIHRRMAS